MFEITEGDVLLAHLNTRTEKHGEEDIGAIDLKISCLAGNTFLDLLDPRLRPTFFQRSGGGQQADMHSPEHLPSLVFPHIPFITWDTKLEGYTAKIGEGMGLNTVTLTKVKIHKFKLEPVDGGTVKVTYTLSCNPTPEQVAAVYPLNGSGILLTLEAPKSDGAGAAKIKDEAVRQKQAEDGQEDILDVQEREEKERADAIAAALQADQAKTDDAPTVELLPPAPTDGTPDTPDTDLVVRLLDERGYVLTAQQVEDPAVLDDAAFFAVLVYLRGDGEAPEALEAFQKKPAEVPAETPPSRPKRDRRPGAGKTVE